MFQQDSFLSFPFSYALLIPAHATLHFSSYWLLSHPKPSYVTSSWRVSKLPSHPVRLHLPNKVGPSASQDSPSSQPWVMPCHPQNLQRLRGFLKNRAAKRRLLVVWRQRGPVEKVRIFFFSPQSPTPPPDYSSGPDRGRLGPDLAQVRPGHGGVGQDQSFFNQICPPTISSSSHFLE